MAMRQLLLCIFVGIVTIGFAHAETTLLRAARMIDV